MFTDEELAWIQKQASRHIQYLEVRPAREKLKSSLHNWRELERIGAEPVPRRALSVLRRYVVSVIEGLQLRIIPGYKTRIDAARTDSEAERYNEYILTNEEKIEVLLKPLLAKLERKLRK